MLLQNLLAEFTETIFSENESESITPAHNISIYRNNYFSQLTQALQKTYPLIVQLVGEDFFKQTAKAYINRYPSCSGNLHEYGEYFSHFLADYQAVSDLAYLAEVAKFEWVCHILYFASDHAAFNITQLENFKPEQFHQFRFMLHPASQVMAFRYPILDIIDLCHHKKENVNINGNGVHLLIIRRQFEISLVSLTLAEFTFLTILNEGNKLTDALAAAINIDDQFKLDEKLPGWIQDKTIVDCKFIAE